MSKIKIYIAFLLIVLIPAIVVMFAFFYPSEFRKNEIARQKEIEISQRFIRGYALNENEISYLRKRGFDYLIDEMQRIYWKDKGMGYKLFERAIGISVQSQMIYTELAQLYINRNEKDKAIMLYEKAIALDPDVKKWETKRYLEELANLYYSEEEFLAASKNYEMCLKFYPRNIDIMFRLSVCYVRIQELDKAMNLLNNCINIDPGNKYLSDIHNLMGVIFENKGVLGEADRHYNESLRINPKNKETESNLKRIEEKSKSQKL